MKQKIKHLLLPIMLLCTFAIVLNMAYNLREAGIYIVKLKQSHKQSLEGHKKEFEKLMLFSEQLIVEKLSELRKQKSKYDHKLSVCNKTLNSQDERINELEKAMEYLAYQYMLTKKKLHRCEMI